MSESVLPGNDAADAERAAEEQRAAGVEGGPDSEAVGATATEEAGRRTPASRPKSAGRSWLVELPIVIGVALVISLLLKTFLVQAFWIPSGSMENTLLVGDRVLVEKITGHARDVHRGDVVVFRDPGGWLSDSTVLHRSGIRGALHSGLAFVGLAPDATGDDLIKRVIGVPGDHVLCCDAQGRMSVNGVALTEPYVHPGDVPSQLKFDVTVPAGDIWVMGDHRSASSDSRLHQDDERKGMVPLDHVIGRAFVVVWPLDRFARLGRPSTFDQPRLQSGSAQPAK